MYHLRINYIFTRILSSFARFYKKCNAKEKQLKKGLILVVMLVSVLALGFSQSASWTVTNTATWIEAVGAIRNGGNNKEYTYPSKQVLLPPDKKLK
jgi:hypothetical protein